MDNRSKKRKRKAVIFRTLCLGFTALSGGLLCVLLFHIARSGMGVLDLQFLNSFPSRFSDQAGIKSAIWGTLWFIGLTALTAIPLGVTSALYLEEFAPKNRWVGILEINIANLAGIPSIVYGILGLVLFVRTLGLGRSVLAGSLTMSLLILPIIIISSREAIRTVPKSLREAAYALGASRWQTSRDQVLPMALPGILTGVILSLSRAIGETAPLIMIGALTYVAFVPEGPMDAFTTLPIQIFNWVSRPQADFHALAAGGIIVLLVVLLCMNAGAIYLRYRSKRKTEW